MRARLIRVILLREYVARVVAKSFVVTTVMLPLIFAASAVIPYLLQRAEKPRQYVVALADGSGGIANLVRGSLTDTLPDGRGRFLVLDTGAGADARMEARRMVELAAYDALVIIPPLFEVSERVKCFVSSPSVQRELPTIERAVSEALAGTRLADKGVDPALVASLARPVKLDVAMVRDGKGESRPESLLLATMAIATLMYFSLAMYGAWTMQSVLTDKTTRIVEVLVSAVSPVELMYGKLLGTGLAGLTQIGIWSLAAFGIVMALPGSDIATLVAPVGFPSMLALSLFYLSGFFLYAGLYAGIGAVCTTNEEAGQMQVPVSLLLMVGFLVAISAVNAPENRAAAFLSFVPFFAPVVMSARMAAGNATWTEAGIALVGILATTALVVYADARVFRVGLLMRGKRPTLREISRWMRAG